LPPKKDRWDIRIVIQEEAHHDDDNLKKSKSEHVPLINQFSLPCDAALAFGAPVWSHSDRFIWIPSVSRAFFPRPTQTTPIESVCTDFPIDRLFTHPDGISVLALHSGATLSLLHPTGSSTSRTFSPSPIASVTLFRGN
jgi:hypothetical protein